MGYNNTGYQSSTKVVTTYNASSSTYTSTITYYTAPATIKTALNNNRPIYIDGVSSSNESVHAWVIDGYGQMTSYIEIWVRSGASPSSGGRTSRQIELTDCLMVHCNFGWDGDANGWYVYGMYDINRRYYLDDDNTQKHYNYSTNPLVIIPTKP